MFAFTQRFTTQIMIESKSLIQIRLSRNVKRRDLSGDFPIFSLFAVVVIDNHSGLTTLIPTIEWNVFSFSFIPPRMAKCLCATVLFVT